MIKFLAFCLVYLAMSGPAGFAIVDFLVKAVKVIDALLDPSYIKLWLPFIILAAVAIPPIYGIWYELRRLCKSGVIRQVTRTLTHDDYADIYEKRADE